MISYLCSTGALSRKGNYADAKTLINLYPLINCDGYELMITNNWGALSFDWCEQLKENSIPIPIMHFSKKIADSYSRGDLESIKEGNSVLEFNCRMAKLLDIKTAVMHLWDWPDNNFHSILDAYDIVLEICTSYGVELLIEMIPCVEAPLLNRIEAIVSKNNACRFTIDTRFLRHQELLENIFDVEWLWRENRISHIHISDCMLNEEGIVKISPILHPGEGIINFENFLELLLKKNYDGYITLESPSRFFDDGTRDVTKINHSISLIKNIVDGKI